MSGVTAHHLVNLAEKLALVTEHWSPKTVAEIKVQGEFTWHAHDETDEFFLVLGGRLTVRMRAGEVVLEPGELFVVPRGTEHCPHAEEETQILLIEPRGIINTGAAGGEQTATPQNI